MVFSSPAFLFYFMPVVVALVIVLPKPARNWALLVASLVFYAWGSHAFVVTLLITSVVDFVLVGQARAAHDSGDQPLRNRWLTGSLLLNLGMLGYFKYAGFVSDSIVGQLTGTTPPAWLANVVLPVGISFFTFQRISYAIDVGTGREEPVERFHRYLLYICLFPQLIAGPIVRYGQIRQQLAADRRVTVDDFSEGVHRFALGLAKKVIVADTLGPVADAVFDPTTDLTTPAALLGIAAYTIQLYFDFSGYSDMAIGLGRMFGFRFPENFNRPYSSESVTEFWRRWHITLSSWFRDYLYIPLGGNRTGHTHRNLIVVFFLTGLWHGAAWTFVAWGAYHGILLLVERRFGGRLFAGVAGRLMTAVLVMLGWVVFRATSLDRAFDIYAAVVSFDFGPLPDSVAVAFGGRAQLVLALGMLVFVVPRTPIPAPIPLSRPGRLAAISRTALVAVAMPLAALLAAAQTFSPFLYFQF